jgi:hypothetical protein
MSNGWEQRWYLGHRAAGATTVTLHLKNTIMEIRSLWRDGFWFHRRIREAEK